MDNRLVITKVRDDGGQGSNCNGLAQGSLWETETLHFNYSSDNTNLSN